MWTKDEPKMLVSGLSVVENWKDPHLSNSRVFHKMSAPPGRDFCLLYSLLCSNTLATWWEELSHWKRPWCWERLKVGGEGDDRGWGGWMASQTQWTRVLESSGRWWRTGKPDVLQSIGWQRVRHDWATEQQQESKRYIDDKGKQVIIRNSTYITRR